MSGKNPLDISMRAIRLGRCVDRLPAGKYLISLDKTPNRMDWDIDIARMVQEINLGDFYEKREPSKEG